MEVFWYDLSNEIIIKTNQAWNGFAWENIRQTISIYDGQNNLISESIRLWDGLEWINYQEGLFAYDINQKLIVEEFQQWDGTSWKASSLHWLRQGIRILKELRNRPFTIRSGNNFILIHDGGGYANKKVMIK